MSKIFAIYDSKAEAYLTPFFMRSKGEAIRGLTACVDDPQHNFSKYAEDFTLFELGEWSEVNCKFDLHSTPLSVCVLLELKRGADIARETREHLAMLKSAFPAGEAGGGATPSA